MQENLAISKVKTTCRVGALLVVYIALATFSCHASGFVVGADVSWVTEMESKGTVFKTVDGTPRDCFHLMKDYGLNAIRLRVWVDPKDGWNNAADTLVKARRAAALGMDIMIDFHYSDNWADPSKQETPRAWCGHDADALCSDVAAHTKEVLGLLKTNGIAPKWVQIGNETSHGVLWTPKRDGNGKTKWIDLGGEIGWAVDVEESNGNIAYHPQNYARFFKAGYDAVKDVFPDAVVIVHIAPGERFEFTEKNLATLRKHGAKWDMVGLSAYPRESFRSEIGGDAKRYDEVNRKFADDVVKHIVRGAERWKCPFMVVETGVEPNPKGNVTVKQVADALAHLVGRVRSDTGGVCKGFFYWEPECAPWMYDKGAFTKDHRPTQIMEVLATFGGAMPDVDRIDLEGAYVGHLQDVCRDKAGHIYWTHTHHILKTDADGKVIMRAEVEGHNAGCEVKDGVLYVAVCPMQGKTGGKTTPECNLQVNEYDAATLALRVKHVLPVNDRAGSLAILPDGSFVVGCLRPQDISPTQVRLHRLSGDFQLVKSVILDNVDVKLGIETIKYHDGELFLSMYKGSNGLLVVLDAATFAEKRRLAYNGTTGLLFDGRFAWCGQTRRNPDTKKYSSCLIRRNAPKGTER